MSCDEEERAYLTDGLNRAFGQAARFRRVCNRNLGRKILMERIVNSTLFLAVIGSGLMAGLFFIFSVCIMTALGKLTPAGGIAAMQSINVVILNGIFLTVFMGTAVLCLALIVAWFLGWMPSGG